jgi:voltage-gated potassium channel
LFSDFHNLEALEKAHPNQASQVFVNLHNDTDALMYVVNFRKYYPAPELVVSIDNSSLEETFITAGVTYVVSRNEIASKLVASYIFEPDVAHINLDILSCARDKDEHDNQEFKVTRSNPYLNKKYLDAFVDMKKKYNAVLLGIYKSSNEGKLKTNPEDDVIIELGDYLIMMVSGRHREKIETEFGITQGRMV